jgi:hypothetical protein
MEINSMSPDDRNPEAMVGSNHERIDPPETTATSNAANGETTSALAVERADVEITPPSAPDLP